MKHYTRDYWHRQIVAAKDDDEQKKWRACAKDIDKRYYAEEADDQPFNLLYANTQILHAALLSNPPSPEVRRRHSESGDNERTAAQMIERALAYMQDQYAFLAPLGLAIEDYLVPGVGQCRVVYDADIETTMQASVEPVLNPDGTPVLDDMMQPVMQETMIEQQRITDQQLSLEFFSWEDFYWQPAKSWAVVDWVAFSYRMDADEIKEQYDIEPDGKDGKDEEGKKKSHTVYEIWCKKTRKVYVICDAHSEYLEEPREDPLGLQGFFPCPRPMVANCRRDAFAPVAFFKKYEHLSDEVQIAKRRLKYLVKAAKMRGVTDEAIAPLLNDVSETEETSYTPVKLRQLLLDTQVNSLESLIAHWPLDQIMQAIPIVRSHLQECKMESYEITGISDIVRGASNAQETAAAQQLKGQWANVRLVRPQREINGFIRALYRIMSEIIGEHFEPHILASMTNMSPEEVMGALQLLSDDHKRNFVVDVETDSTIAKDENEERNERMQLLQTLVQALGQVVPLVSHGMLSADLAKEMILMTVRSFKHGRSLEEYVQGMQGTQEQLQGLQQQAQQQIQQLQQQLHQVGMQLQQAQRQLQQVDMQENAREDMETQAEAAKDHADVRYKDAQTQKILTETGLMAQQSYNPVYPVQ